MQPMEKNHVGNRHLWFWWLIFLAFITIVILAITHIPSLKKKAEVSQPGLYSINHFIDGDTIAVDMNGDVETIRMIGIDTPETHKPDTPVQCYGEEAASYTKRLIGSSKVRLQADALDTNRDRYGRLLRYVYLADGTLVEEKIITAGYGFAYTSFPFEKADQFKKDEQEAKAGNRGLWAACEVTAQTNGVRQTNPAAR